MEGRIALGRVWPGFTQAGTVVLPVPEASWPPPSAPVVLHGCCFSPKSELHVTIVGSALGAGLRAELESNTLDEACLAAAFHAQTWQLERTGPCMRLRRLRESVGPEAPADAASLIERIGLPAMAGFHAELGRLLGCGLPVPPPHVTLYTHGDESGIGVPDEATLLTLAVDFAG